jgi:hypothetical protein
MDAQSQRDGATVKEAIDDRATQRANGETGDPFMKAPARQCYFYILVFLLLMAVILAGLFWFVVNRSRKDPSCTFQ